MAGSVTNGFAQIPRTLLENPGLSATAKLLYACVQSHANEEGVAWPSIERLAETTGWERKKVMRGLTELVAAGWLERHRRGRTEVNAYRVMYHQGTSPGELSTGRSLKKGELSTGRSLKGELSTGRSLHEVPPRDFMKSHHGTSPGRNTPATTPAVGICLPGEVPPGDPNVPGTYVPGTTAVVAVSPEAREVIDHWRAAHGKRRPPRLNPRQLAALEEAIPDLGVARLKESADWSAEQGVVEFIKCVRAAYTKRLKDEERQDTPRRNGHKPAAPVIGGEVALCSTCERWKPKGGPCPRCTKPEGVRG